MRAVQADRATVIISVETRREDIATSGYIVYPAFTTRHDERTKPTAITPSEIEVRQYVTARWRFVSRR